MKPSPQLDRLCRICGVIALVTLLSTRSLLSSQPDEWRHTQGFLRATITAIS
jgi:hypothetical protein